jgi:hypothetical protein
MDTIALGIIAIGVVAAIGVVLVAMNSSDSGTAAAEAPTEAAKPKQAAQPRPRARRRQQALPNYVVSAPQQNGHPAGAQDPLVTGFMQVVSSELQALRQQQDKIDQRLKLINGIAELMHDVQGTSVNGTPVASTSNHRSARG